MPMPHRTQMQVIKRRLVGKDGSARVQELRAILTELPDYRNGPFADIRKWVNGQIEESRVRKRVVHRDSLEVRREGAAQIAFVGAPNAGKSSLLQALSSIQIRTGDYAFTTTRPVPALMRIHDVLVQLVEIPGLIEGAHEDRGGGKALLGVLRHADAIALCHSATAPVVELETIRAELVAAGIERPSILVATKLDDADPGAVERLAQATGLVTVGVSVLDDDSLDALREELWRLTGLIRVFLRRPGDADAEPVALPAGSTVADAASRVHDDLGRASRGGRVWGPSARFEGQRVGRGHVLAEDDVVEVV
jgi:small GTP-binding protein